MSRYEHLSLYQACYTFSREIYRIKLKLPAALKHDLGAQVFTSCLRCLRCVIFANGSQRKSRPLQELLLEIESLRTYTRLLHDLRGISKGEFQTLSERLREMAAQANAWHKWECDRVRKSES
ncbi:four helix bundle protein [bacterium]|jgi:hypothetical protein|nr:four helix bundle protein [bacterium]